MRKPFCAEEKVEKENPLKQQKYLLRYIRNRELSRVWQKKKSSFVVAVRKPPSPKNIECSSSSFGNCPRSQIFAGEC